VGVANSRWIEEEDDGGTGTLNKYAEFGSNITSCDACFVDEGRLDLTLASGSPAYAIPGFEPIPFRQIGLAP
jgi:hypothetical protein